MCAEAPSNEVYPNFRSSIQIDGDNNWRPAAKNGSATSQISPDDSATRVLKVVSRLWPGHEHKGFRKTLKRTWCHLTDGGALHYAHKRGRLRDTLAHLDDLSPQQQHALEMKLACAIDDNLESCASRRLSTDSAESDSSSANMAAAASGGMSSVTAAGVAAAAAATSGSGSSAAAAASGATPAAAAAASDGISAAAAAAVAASGGVSAAAAAARCSPSMPIPAGSLDAARSSVGRTVSIWPTTAPEMSASVPIGATILDGLHAGTKNTLREGVLTKVTVTYLLAIGRGKSSFLKDNS